MLKENGKNFCILIFFCFFMREVLTVSTQLFVAFGIVLSFLSWKPSRPFRNALALGVFASYWLKYGKLVDPEIGINFLTSIIMLKILERESARDRYMIFFGLILLTSAGALFERTLSYVLFFSLSFLVLIAEFYASLGKKLRPKDLGIAVLWVFPLTFILFFIVPRMMSPIPFQQNTKAPGEVGYTPDVNISDVEALTPNDSPVFQVKASRSLLQSELYWRGNTLSYNDGWNWKEMIQDKEAPDPLLGLPDQSGRVKQDFRIFTRPEYFFTLDYPGILAIGRDIYALTGNMRTVPQKRWEWAQKYEAWSDPEETLKDEGKRQAYLQVTLPKKDKEYMASAFKGDGLHEINTSVKFHFLKEKFSYSLGPGKITSLREFLEKKTGFCVHYASTLALILRVKGIPARLVSGYMGGQYNKFADFYLISQNDAHVWVEAFAEGQWQRLDPTEWIAPDRVRLGGDAFMQSAQSGFQSKSFFKLPPFLFELKQRFAQWDYLFYQWLEEMDYQKQEEWLSRLKLKRQWLFSLVPLTMVIFMVIYLRFLSRNKGLNLRSPKQELWALFYKRLRKKGILPSDVSLHSARELLEARNDEKALEVFDQLVGLCFNNEEISFHEVRKKIRKL